MIQGVDVYHGDERIDWPGLAASGIGFAYIKVREGLTLQDPAVVANFAAARAAGLLCGGYHFFRPLADAGRQVEAFAADLHAISGVQLMPALDFEPCGECDEWLTLPDEGRAGSVVTAVETALSVTGRRPVVYTGPGFVADVFRGSFPAGHVARLWVADARPVSLAKGTPEVPEPWHSWMYWQVGSIPAGSAGAGLDADLFGGSLEDLKALARKVA